MKKLNKQCKCKTSSCVIILGKLGISVTGRVELTLIVEGMWKKPFGLNYIAFGNLQLTAGILPQVLIPNLGK